MFTGFLIGLAGGINVLTALYLGAGKKQALSHTVHSALIVSICSGLALLLFGICFARPVLELSLIHIYTKKHRYFTDAFQGKINNIFVLCCKLCDLI